MDPLPILIFELDRDIAKILAVILALAWVLVLFVFFAMAINMSRMRKDIRTLQQIATAQHREVQQRQYEQQLREYEQQQQQQQQQQYQQPPPPAASQSAPPAAAPTPPPAAPPASPPTQEHQQPTSQEFPQQPPAH